MSKASPTNSNKTGIKPNNIQRETFKKLTLDLNGTEFKSALTNSTLNQDKPLFSPSSSPLEKGSMIHSQTKSPHAKNNSIMSPTEIQDGKDISKFDKKIHPQTTKAAGSIQISSNLSKTKKMLGSNEKVAPSKLKEYQIKGMFPGSETFLASKTVQNKDSHRINLNVNPKDNKQKIMEEPPKKASVPITLAMTLNQVYSGAGSSSHRATLNSSKSNQFPGTESFVYPPFNRKNSKKTDTEAEQPQINAIVSNKHFQTQHIANSVLSELGSAPSERSKTMAKVNVMSGFNNTGNDTYKGERVPSPQNKTAISQSNQYNDLLKLLNEKNKEIQRLSQDKVELKSTLDSITGEVKSFKKMKGLIKEKEAVIGNLQASLMQAAKDSDVLMKELQKESLLPKDLASSKPQSRVDKKGGSQSPSRGELEGIKQLIGQLKSLTEGLEDPSADLGEEENQQAKGKKPENSYALIKSKTLNGLNTQSESMHSYPLDFSHKGILNTIEDSIDKRKGESPYYEATTNSSNQRDERVTVEVKKNGAIFKRVPTSTQNSKRLGNDVVIKKGDSLLGTPGRMRISTDKVETHFGLQPNTTSGADLDMLKRKFSHNPRISSEGLGDFLNKKHSVAEVGISSSHRENKAAPEERLDIGKALGGLKDKIARMLNKHKEDHTNLKQTQEVCLQKLNELLNKQMVANGKA